MLVRTPERAITPLPSTAAFFVAGPGDNASASVARTMLASGVLGDEIIFGADGTSDLAHTSETATKAIVDSIHHRHRGGDDFGRFTRQVDSSQLGRCVLFLPGQPGPWLERISAQFSLLPAPPLLIITVDGDMAAGSTRWSDRFFETEGSGLDRDGLMTYYDTLTDLGAQVQVIHQGSGRALGPAELVALRTAS